MGLAPGAFARLLNDEQAAMQAEAVQGNPVLEALTRYFSAPGAQPLTVSAQQLRDLLQAQSPSAPLPHFKRLTADLTRMAQGLRDSGIDIVQTRDKRNKRAVLQISTNGAFEAVRRPGRRVGSDLPF